MRPCAHLRSASYVWATLARRRRTSTQAFISAPTASFLERHPVAFAEVAPPRTHAGLAQLALILAAGRVYGDRTDNPLAVAADQCASRRSFRNLRQ